MAVRPTIIKPGEPIPERTADEKLAPSPSPQLLDKVLEQTADRLDRLAVDYSTAIAGATGHLRRALLRARGIRALKEALDSRLMAEIMPLMNDPNGFLTDRGKHNPKQSQEYSVEIVRDCVITACLEGFYLDGNEFNIIAGRFFGTLNGWQRKFEQLPGITDVRIAPGIPLLYNGQHTVRVALSWVYQGKTGRLIGPDGKPGQPFPIIAHASSSADNLIGKAKRKAYKLAYEQVTGSRQTLDDADVADEAMPIATATAKLDAVAEQLLPVKASVEQLAALRQLAKDLEWSADEARKELPEGIVHPEDLSVAQADQLIDRWTAWLAVKSVRMTVPREAGEEG